MVINIQNITISENNVRKQDSCRCGKIELLGDVYKRISR